MLRRLLSACALSLPLFATAAAPPIEAFFEPAAIQGVKLSPSGRWMAVLNGTSNGRNKLTVVDLDGKETSRIVASFSKFDVANVSWVSEDYLIFSLVDRSAPGRKDRHPGLLSVDRDGKRIKELIKFIWETEFPPMGGGHPLEPNNFLIHLGAPGTNEVIVAEVQYDVAGEFSHTQLRAVNVATGALRPLTDVPSQKIKGWVFDNQGTPRAAYNYEGGKQTLYWKEANGKWKELVSFPVNKPPYELAYVDGKDQLYVEMPSGAGGTSAIHQFDFANGKPFPDSVIETPGFDSQASPIYEYGSNTLVGVSTEGDSQVLTWFAPAMKEVQKKADALLPGRVNYLRCGACINPNRILVMSYSDTSPMEYLLYSVADDAWQRVGASRPRIDPEQMAQLDMHMAKTRDGANLPVWITATPRKDAKPRPAVVVVHGGPWVRGVSWAWDPEAQFLASRGYIVIEPEFRGSKGYGEAHFRAGWKQWGQRMQDDVSDALRYAIDKGLVDGSRVCIAGASYGGYSTLMGLAKDPAQYRCGVAWVAVSDPRYMYDVHWSDILSDSKQHSLPELLGDPVKDADMLKANAPIALAAKIKAPVLLAYGNRDRRVPIVHGEDMRTALTDAGNKPEWIVYDGEGHGWSRPENKIDFWRRVEAFLDKNLK